MMLYGIEASIAGDYPPRHWALSRTISSGQSINLLKTHRSAKLLSVSSPEIITVIPARRYTHSIQIQAGQNYTVLARVPTRKTITVQSAQSHVIITTQVTTQLWTMVSPGITVSGSGLNILSDTGRGSRIGMAIDITNKKSWIFNPWTGKWNNGTLSAQNPVTAAGGSTLSITGAIFPAWAGFGSTPNQATLYVNASDFLLERAIPSGFSAWGSGTFNPSQKGANITLSNGNMTAASGTNAWQSVAGTASLSSGKYYFEISYDVAGSSNGWIGGYCNASQDTANYIGSTASTGAGAQVEASGYGGQAGVGSFFPNTSWDGNWRNARAQAVGKSSGKYYWEAVTDSFQGGVGNKVMCGFSNDLTTGPHLGSGTDGGIGLQPNNNSGNAAYYYNTGTTTLGATIGTSVAIGMAIDIDAKKVWFYNPVTALWNADVIGNQNPATGTGGISVSLASAPFYPAVAFSGSGSDQFTTRFTSGSFSNSIPSGFSAWV